MLAAHQDQENLVALRQGMTTKGRTLGQGFQPKTPGARYPNTPLKIPLNDENAVATVGKTFVRTQKAAPADKTAGKLNGTVRRPLATPIDTRRAPLGNKTTNARALTGRATSVKERISEFNKTNAKPTTTAKKHKIASPSLGRQNSVKVRADQQESSAADEQEEDIEYAPPKPIDLPYESDIIADGALTFEGLAKENLFKGYYDHFYNPVDEDGVRMRDREFAETMKKAAELCDDRARKDIEEMDWSVSDVPETKMPTRTNATDNKVVATKAKSRLGQTAKQKKQSSILAPLRRHQEREPSVSVSNIASKTPSTTGYLASKSTLGFAKGRSACFSLAKSQAPSSAMRLPVRPRSKTPTEAVATSDQAGPMRPNFTSIFDVDDGEVVVGLGCEVNGGEDYEDDFELKLSE